MRLNRSRVFGLVFFLSPLTQRESPACLFDFLSFQHDIWHPGWGALLCAFDRGRASTESWKSSQNQTVHFWKCHFGMMIGISPALQKKGISKSCSFIWFQWYYLCVGKHSLRLPALPVGPCCLCFWLIPRLKNTRELFKHNIYTVHPPKNRQITEVLEQFCMFSLKKKQSNDLFCIVSYHQTKIKPICSPLRFKVIE